MSITSSDLLVKLSVTSGSAGNSTAGTPTGSLGKYISTTQITDATVGNLFDAITGDENVASDVEYRAFFWHNNHGSLTWTDPKVWISSETAGGASVALSIDTTAASAVGASSDQAKTIVDESTAPATQTFSAPTTKVAGLSLGDLVAGNVKAVWVRRTAANTVALAVDGAVISGEGDSL